jgi:hypothetical protein
MGLLALVNGLGQSTVIFHNHLHATKLIKQNAEWYNSFEEKVTKAIKGLKENPDAKLM